MVTDKQVKKLFRLLAEGKTLAQAERLYDQLAAARIDRGGVVLTFGGGVAGDLGGFVAATRMFTGRETPIAPFSSTALAVRTYSPPETFVQCSLNGPIGSNVG